ncbi:MAG: sigma 54-interacting transcriptional regulator, partial [Sandaracinaceae bacterium]
MSEGTRILERDGEPAWVRRRATLSVLEGPSSPRTIELEGTVHVGSGPRMDVRLEDPAVSAHHFELSVDDQGWRLRDVESTNGTYVLGLRCRDVRLADGVEIRAGETRLRFALGDDDVAVPLSRRTNFGGLIGHSAAMRSAFAVLERAAKSDATVLITGESGTGKELAARAVHDASPRSGGPYVVFDCGAAAPSLLESQLFGHVKGAFTGAVESRAGVFEEADGGTLVLDELGELPLELQPKLLRALEHRTVTRIGDHEPIRVDVRFVACTNRSLTDEVQRGAFREDLFFRVSVLTVRLPALRERPEEIGRL